MNMPSDEYAEVLVPPMHDCFLYSVPATLSDKVTLGSQVEVPLGKRTAKGFVVNPQKSLDSAPSYSVKPIERLTNSEPCFHDELLTFYRWIADYYCYPLGKVLDTAIPESVPSKEEKQWFIETSFPVEQLKGAKQVAIWEHIKEAGEGGTPHALLSKLFPHSSGTLKRLLELGAIQNRITIESCESYLEYPIDAGSEEVTLTPEQQNIHEAITDALDAQSYNSFLIHGITGSGKTELYIEAARKVIERGGGAMILVPEIALTPQLVDRFRKRINAPIALLHSSLTKRKRWECWKALRAGRCQLVLGARSTIFAPLKNIELIIVDEEHDGSYKQGDNLRYNARDLAYVRGRFNDATVVLGSATPSVDTYYKAMTKKISYAPINERPFQQEPLEYQVINLNRIKRSEMASPSISPQLVTAIEETLIKQQQVFLLYNRRGFARYMQCRACGEVVYCPNCSVPLTYHQNVNALMCHYCAYSATPSKFCNACTDKPRTDTEPLLETRGAGTQRIVEELTELFPQARIARLDRDSAQKLESLKQILEDVRSGSINILAGTQMIAKGHDLPGVTLVGIIDCDVGLHMPDFRSGERVYQLLTQAGGRAGRRQDPGKVVLQTRVPHHPCIQSTVKEDYHSFAKRELQVRQQMLYPPFAKLVRIIGSSTDTDEALQYLAQIRQLIDDWCEKNEKELHCLGPAKAPIEKVKALYRSHLIVKGGASKDLRTLVQLLKSHLKVPKTIRLVYDFDPLDML